LGARQRRGADRPLSPGAGEARPLERPVGLPLPPTLRGRLLRRYKRFLADIESDEGRKLTVHCPDPGSMRGCLRDGAPVRFSTSTNPKRKLAHTLEMIRVGRGWVGVNTGRANDAAARALEVGALPELAEYAGIEREVRTGERSRLDFRLVSHARGEPGAWLEVKSVTLAEGGTGLFPDSVTERGRRHLEELMRLRRAGERAALLFLVQRADCAAVAPAEAIDPRYAETLREAAEHGVELYALGARVTARSIRVERRLPVLP
jgi:sugar fermentation stimulation protein A